MGTWDIVKSNALVAILREAFPEPPDSEVEANFNADMSQALKPSNATSAKGEADELLAQLAKIFEDEAEYRDMILWTPMNPRKEVRGLTRSDIENIFATSRVFSPMRDFLQSLAARRPSEEHASDAREALAQIAKTEQAHCYFEPADSEINDLMQTRHDLRKCGDIARAALGKER